jgi:hypothetical protein
MRAARYGVVAALAAVVGLVPSGATAGAPTTVSIKAVGNPAEFSGQVKSTPPCRGDRKVTVLRKKKGKDPKIGSDTTESSGQWSTGNSGETKGKFYAKVKKTGSCEKAKSSTIKVLPQM